MSAFDLNGVEYINIYI